MRREVFKGQDAMLMSCLQVGSLLLAFLPTSLQEQISSRKYFYKSGHLIKDGIITLSNTDFSRDIMDQVWCFFDAWTAT